MTSVIRNPFDAITSNPTDLGGLTDALCEVDGITAVLTERTREWRDGVSDLMDELSTAGATMRTNAGQVILTSPKPLVTIDAATFGPWAARPDRPLDATTRRRVVVTDGTDEVLADHVEHARDYADADGVMMPSDNDDAANLLDSFAYIVSRCRVEVQWIVPDDADAMLMKNPRIIANDDGTLTYVTPDGEQERVPGVSVMYRTGTVQVRLDKDAKSNAAERARIALGLA